MSDEWIAFLSVLAQSAIALLALIFIAFQIARERWIHEPMRKLVAIQTLLEFLVPAFFAFLALLPIQQIAIGSLCFARWQLGGMLAGLVGMCTAAYIAIYGIRYRQALDPFGLRHLKMQWLPFMVYVLIFFFAIWVESLALTSGMMLWLLISGSAQTWMFFAEKDKKDNPPSEE
jgi:hypothetical protein